MGVMQRPTRLVEFDTTDQNTLGYSDATAVLPVLELVEGVNGQLGEEFRPWLERRLVDIEARIVQPLLLWSVRKRRP
jgi:hypothetical protein